VRAITPELVILAGPNGSGKSTLFEKHIKKWSLPFVNRDVIAKSLNPTNPDAAALRRAKALGYRTRVVFICLETSDLNVARVVHRVARGGHAVAPGAIVARYDRAIKSAVEAAALADDLLLFDNSVEGLEPRMFARFSNGELASVRRILPVWAKRAFGSAFDSFRSVKR